MTDIIQSPLGKHSIQPETYAPEILFPVLRQHNRAQIGISLPLPFYGFDIWQEYEISWLNPNGKPAVAMGQFIFPCNSPYIIESKSLKLYLRSLSDCKFTDCAALTQTITRDLSQYAGAAVMVNITPLHLTQPLTLTSQLTGTLLDELDVQVTHYQLNPQLLTTESTIVTETVYSHLLKSVCPVTNQPDWGSVQINYTGPKITATNLLKFIISFRNYAEFAENCVECIFIEIMHRCQPTDLTVSAFYTRRGGKDINPIRSTHKDITPNLQRLIRQ